MKIDLSVGEEHQRWRGVEGILRSGLGLIDLLPYFFFAFNSANIFWLPSNFGSIANAFL